VETLVQKLTQVNDVLNDKCENSALDVLEVHIKSIEDRVGKGESLQEQRLASVDDQVKDRVAAHIQSIEARILF